MQGEDTATMPGCDELRDNLAAYQDGELDTAEREQVQKHLASCEACRQEAQAQHVVKTQLRALKERTQDVGPPPHIWNNARDAWNHRDAAQRHRVQLRLALVAACILLLTFGIVWARRVQTFDFPTAIVLRDFRQIQQNPPKPAFASADADAAAAYLRVRLNADVPPIHLALSGAKLRGADVLSSTTPPLGRLLYETPQGLVAVYIAPRGSRLTGLAERPVGGRTLHVSDSDRDIGLFAWSQQMVGYGLALPQPVSSGEALARDAHRATSQPHP
jgi:anti-sigma factor RsiW